MIDLNKFLNRWTVLIVFVFLHLISFYSTFIDPLFLRGIATGISIYYIIEVFKTLDKKDKEGADVK